MAESPSPQGCFPRDWVGDVWAWLRRAGGWFGGDGLGRWGERVAEEHLRQRGYRILARSHRSLLGEIDLIVRDGDWVVFVEVKTRTGSAKGHPSKRSMPANNSGLCGWRSSGSSGIPCNVTPACDST